MNYGVEMYSGNYIEHYSSLKYMLYILTGLFASGPPGPAHGMRLSSTAFPPK